MKNIKSIFIYAVLSFLIVFSVSSCKKNNEGHGAPVITKIRTVFKSDDTTNTVTSFDSTTNDGKIGTLYAIIGNNLSTTKQILINGVSIYFNIAYTSNTTLQFSVPDVVPFSNDSTSNTLTVINAYGKATYPFVIEQPFPGINSVDQLAGNAGDIITITGTTFVGVSKVLFGTVPGTVVTNSPTVLTVKVPAGLTDGQIFVTTKATKGGGTATGPVLSSGTSYLSNNITQAHQSYSVFGFNTAIFDDAYENNWNAQGSWNDGVNLKADSTKSRRGIASFKYTYAGGYDAFVVNPGTGNAVDANTAIKFSIYGGKGTNGKLIKLILNWNFNTYVIFSLVEGKWTDYQIPVANFVDASNPLPSSINPMIFQEFSGNPSQINIDDMGLVELPAAKK